MHCGAAFEGLSQLTGIDRRLSQRLRCLRYNDLGEQGHEGDVEVEVLSCSGWIETRAIQTRRIGRRH